MNKKEITLNGISPMLENITQQQVVVLDQENTDGDGWNYYCNGQVTNAIVFEDEISGIVKEMVKEYRVKLKVNDMEVSCSCSCESDKVICNHVIALLYSWVNDHEDFTDVGDLMKRLHSMDKQKLIDVIQRLLTEDPMNFKYFNKHRGYDADNLELDSLAFE